MATVPHEPIRSFATASWRAELLPRQPYEIRYTARKTAIGYAFDSQFGAHAFATDRIRPFRVRAHTLAVVPEGCDVYSRSSQGGEYLTLAPMTGDLPGARQITDAPNPVASRAAHALRALLLGGDPIDPSAFEHHATLLGACGDAPEPDPPAAMARWMTPRRLDRIAEFVDARLETGLTVAELADALDLSPDFLCRAFKAAVGLTPHAYIAEQRLARVRALIRAGERDLSAIAYASGFSSHAHMTAAFRQRLGLTPRGFRAALG